MKRAISLFGSVVLIGLSIQLAASMSAAADPVSTITLPSGNWDVTTTVDVVSATTSDSLEYGISSPISSKVCPTGTATTCAGGESDTFPTLSGELVFYLTDLTCSQTFSSTDGTHARIDQTDPTHWTIGWDDAGGGTCDSPDGDFDDITTSVVAEGADMELNSKIVSFSSDPTGTPNLVFANDTASQNTVRYRIVITNNGTIDAQDVVVTDALPDIGTLPAFGSADFCVGTGATDCATNGFNAYPPDSGPGANELPVGTVPSGESRTIIIRAHANSDLRGGPHPGITNSATVSSSTGDPNPGNESGTSGAVEIDTVPDGPSIVQRAVGGNQSASLEFSNDGEVDGGQPITSYDVPACETAAPAVCVAQTPIDPPTPNATLNGQPIFSYVVTGLHNGTQYSIGVVANNAVGPSDPADAGSAYASTSAFTDFNTTGVLTADTGFSGGARTCTDPTSVTCKSIVAKYSFQDPNLGIVYNLDAEPITPEVPCLEILSFDPTSANYGDVGEGDECVANKMVRSTYPVPSGSGTPHLEYEQLDASTTTLAHGAPCLALKLAPGGNPTFPLVCTNPSFPLFNDPAHPGQMTNFCPEGTGWTKQKPCAYIYYDVEKLPGFDLSGNRPIPCSTAGCDDAIIIGSSVQAGININGGHQVPGWCTKRLTRVPCTFKYNWLNKKTGNGNNDAQGQWYEIGDGLRGHTG
jgi:uncharacterized repeat protein (TIGR01451 family)